MGAEAPQDEKSRVQALQERARHGEGAMRRVVEIGMLLEHLRQPIHSQSTNGAPKLRERVEKRFLAAVAKLEDALDAEDEIERLGGPVDAP